jgi:hypothetical protein
VIDALTQRTNIRNKKKAGRPGGVAGPEWLPDAVRRMLGDKQAALDRMFGGVGDMYNDDGTPRNGIAPASYTPPSHSEIAKDHHAGEGEVHAGEDDHTAGHDHDDAPAGGGDDHDHVPSGDAHAHESDWLNTMAEALAGAATRAIASKVGAAWDLQAAGGVTESALGAIDDEVDDWFAHPDDCRPKWEGIAQGFLRNPSIAARLRAEMNRSRG